MSEAYTRVRIDYFGRREVTWLLIKSKIDAWFANELNFCLYTLKAYNEGDKYI